MTICGQTGLSNPESLALESDALPTALRGPAVVYGYLLFFLLDIEIENR